MTKPSDTKDALHPVFFSFDSWENETVAMSASITTSQSSSSDESSNIQVSISGVIFSLDAFTFEKLRKLPWQEETSEEAAFSLSTSPELFDVLVHHVLFGTLPQSLIEHDKEELEIMALSLDLQDLAQHLAVAPPARRRLKRRASMDQAIGSTSSNRSFCCSSVPVKKKTAALRSWAAVKRWSSTSRLIKSNNHKNQNHILDDNLPPLRDAPVLAKSRHYLA